MVEKKSKDLTRIEELSEFHHEDDESIDSQFESFLPKDDKAELTDANLFEIPSSPPPVEEELEEVSFELTSSPEDSEVSMDLSAEDTLGEIFEENSTFEVSAEPEEDLEGSDLPEFSNVGAFSTSFEDAEENADNEKDTNEDSLAEISFETPEESPPERVHFEQDHTAPSPEKFEDVRTFAQDFSYGKVSSGGGNPPYTIIVRHIKFKDDAESILDLLSEFGVITPQNQKDTQRALELGSLIIPQISEYTAIVLAHKLRRFDLDLEVGLADEVHPSKSIDGNPRGLLKKTNLRQNRSEGLKLGVLKTAISDIIVSTSATLPGFTVDNYIGVQTAFAIVEESELEKLQYVQKVEREHTDIIDYENIENSKTTSEAAFKDYNNSFSLLYEDLSQQLKQKAFAQNANALLGLSYQVSPLQFDRSQNRVNAYQITCSATLAVVSKETT